VAALGPRRVHGQRVPVPSLEPVGRAHGSRADALLLAGWLWFTPYVRRRPNFGHHRFGAPDPDAVRSVTALRSVKVAWHVFLEAIGEQVTDEVGHVLNRQDDRTLAVRARVIERPDVGSPEEDVVEDANPERRAEPVDVLVDVRRRPDRGPSALLEGVDRHVRGHGGDMNGEP
jgi:hypothetical protein